MTGNEKNSSYTNSQKLQELLRNEIYNESMLKDDKEFSCEKIQACVTLLESYEETDPEELERAQKKFLDSFMKKYGIPEKRRRWRNRVRNTVIVCCLTTVIACIFRMMVSRTQVD